MPVRVETAEFWDYLARKSAKLFGHAPIHRADDEHAKVDIRSCAGLGLRDSR